MLLKMMSKPIIRSFGILKKCPIKMNMEYNLHPSIGKAIMQDAHEVALEKLNNHFPLVVWQTGSDTVKRSQSSNLATEINSRLIPKLKHLHTSLQAKTNEFSDIVNGPTHTQEATPLTYGQKFSAYTTQVKYGIERVLCSFPRMYQVHSFYEVGHL